MTANIDQVLENVSHPQVEQHLAWHGKMAGLEAQDILQDHAPHVYLLRAGELPSHYYVSFVCEDKMVQHVPFMIRVTPHGWFCRNSSGSGPFMRQTIDDVVHAIIHCEKESLRPLHAVEVK